MLIRNQEMLHADVYQILKDQISTIKVFIVLILDSIFLGAKIRGAHDPDFYKITQCSIISEVQ